VKAQAYALFQNASKSTQNQNMRIRLFALGLVWAASLFGQYGHPRFSWQEACFKNPGAPYCPGHDYAIKPPAPPAKDAAPRNIVTNPFSSTQRGGTPSLIEVGGIDWRFADPFADALVGFNFSGLSASPLARSLIVQLGASQGLTEADMRKIFDGLSGVDQVALSARGNRVVVMVTGSVADSTFPAPEAGFKALPVSGNAMLVGHADAVDQAAQRIAMKVPPAELTRLAEERQASSEFWAIGAPGLVGQQAVSAGVKRFSLTVSIQNRFTSDLAFEFNGVPSANTLRTWQTKLGAATLEGNVVHVRMSMEGDEVQQKFAKITASPIGQRLAVLVAAARYLPVRDTTVPKQTKPVIYGLDGGPKEVN
jgi:hypothetical protein